MILALVLVYGLAALTFLIGLGMAAGGPWPVPSPMIMRYEAVTAAPRPQAHSAADALIPAH